jgi:hypothetical protein
MLVGAHHEKSDTAILAFLQNYFRDGTMIRLYGYGFRRNSVPIHNRRDINCS